MRVYAPFILAFVWLECSAGKSKLSELFSIKKMSKGPIAVIAAGLTHFITSIGYDFHSNFRLYNLYSIKNNLAYLPILKENSLNLN